MEPTATRHPSRHLHTFERWFFRLPSFLNNLWAWQPDYVVPVAKKGCKLLRSCNRLPGVKMDSSKVKYRMFFLLREPAVAKRKIAAVDDATQYTSALQEYRSFFENKGAIVNTYSFVGHDNLYQGKHERYDELAQIGKYLPGPVYQEYILQQAYWLLNNGDHFDLDHLVFEAKIPPRRFEEFCAILRQQATLLFLEDHYNEQRIKRFSLNDPSFHQTIPYLRDDSVGYGQINKIKFSLDRDTGSLFFSPMIFPSWDTRRISNPENIIRDFPFELPFRMPASVDASDKSSLHRVYYNIYLAAVSSLAHSFSDFCGHNLTFLGGFALRRNDLDAILGEDLATEFASRLAKLLNSPTTAISNKGAAFASPRERHKASLRSFGTVIDHCRASYEAKIRKKKTRLNVHYYMPYERLFRSYGDPINLAEELDRCCDIGVIVAETTFQNGRFLRVCRSGEPDGDTAFKRTQVILPLVIDQFRKILRFAAPEIEPMLFNKALANFVFDYPPQSNPDLHCFLGVPNDFGSLVHVHDLHRAPTKPNIYATDKISPHYIWDRQKRRFCATPKPDFISKVKDLFDERQEIPYTEITTYFNLLAEIFRQFEKVDVLNILSIAREENYFYTHVLFNARSAYSAIARYMEEHDRRLLHEAGKQAESARVKLHGARGIAGLMKQIDAGFANNLDYVTALRTLTSNYIPYSEGFSRTLDLLYELTQLQKVFVNLALAFHTGSLKYWKEYCSLLQSPHFSRDLLLPTANLDQLRSDETVKRDLLVRIFEKLSSGMRLLPREEPLLSTRILNDEKRRARNIATHYAYKHSVVDLFLLYLDFSGLRTIPEPKESVISLYYQVVEESRAARNGVRLYGGRSGDDAFTILFTNGAAALLCAKDIKEAFAGNLFLASSGGDIKFGLAYRRLPETEKEQHILSCWGDAKDCCEFKGAHFRNRGHLLISATSFSAIQLSEQNACLKEVVPFDGVTLGSGSPLYYHNAVRPFGSKQ